VEREVIAQALEEMGLSIRGESFTAPNETVFLVKVRAKPGSKIESLSILDGVLQVALKERPIDGQANKALVKKLGKLFGVSSSGVTLLRGERSKEKDFKICFVFEGRKNLKYYLEKLKLMKREQKIL
jgi:uncharacterized protein (TIGR00251 family)